MKKKFIIASLFVAAALALSACGKSSGSGISSSISAPESLTAQEESGETYEESSEEYFEDTSDINDRNFFDGVNRYYMLTGDGGRWYSDININDDGTFNGNYVEWDESMTGEGYEEGTKYTCEFSGQFTQLTKVDDYTYEATVMDKMINSPTDQTDISNGVQTIYVNKTGLENADTVLFYKSGAPVSSLPSELAQMVFGPMGIYDYSSITELPVDAIYNILDGCVFVSGIKREYEDFINDVYYSQSSGSESSEGGSGNSGAEIASGYFSINDIGLSDILNFDEGGPACHVVGIEDGNVIYEHNHMEFGDDGYYIVSDGGDSAKITDATKFYVGDPALYYDGGANADAKWIRQVSMNEFISNITDWSYTDQVVVQDGAAVAVALKLQVAG